MSGNLLLKDKGSHICSAQSDSIGSLQFDKRIKSRSYSSQFTLNDQILVSVDRREHIRPIEDIVIVEVDLGVGICKDSKSSSWKYSDIIQLDEMSNQNPWVKKMTTYDTFIDKDVLDSIRDEAMEPNKLYLMKHQHKHQTTEKIASNVSPDSKPLRTVAAQFNPSESNQIMGIDKLVYPTNENNTVNVYLKLKNQILRNELIINTGDIKLNNPEIKNQYISSKFIDFSNKQLSYVDDNIVNIDTDNPDQFKKRKDHDAIIVEPIFKKENVNENFKTIDASPEVEDIPFAEEIETSNQDHINDNRNTISKSLQYFLPAFDASETNQELQDNLDLDPETFNSRGEVTTDDDDSSTSITNKPNLFEKDELESLNPDDYDESIMDGIDQPSNELQFIDRKFTTLERKLYNSEYLADLDDIICQENLVMQFQQDQKEDVVSEDEVERYMIDIDIDIRNEMKQCSNPKEIISNSMEIKPEINSFQSKFSMNKESSINNQECKEPLHNRDKQPAIDLSRTEDQVTPALIDFSKISISSVPYRSYIPMQSIKPKISLYSDRKEKFLNASVNSSLQFFKQISDEPKSPIDSRCSSPSLDENTQSSQKNELSTNSSDNSMVIKDVSSDEPHIFFARSQNYACDAVHEESEEEIEQKSNEDSSSIISNLSTTEEIPKLQKSNSISDNISIYSSSSTVTVNEIIVTNLFKKPIDSTPGSFEEFLKNRNLELNKKRNSFDANEEIDQKNVVNLENNENDLTEEQLANSESSCTEDTSLSSSELSKPNPVLRQGESIEDIAKYLTFPKEENNLKRSSAFDSKLNVLYNEENEDNLLYPNKYTGRAFSPSSDDNTSLKVFCNSFNTKPHSISPSEMIKTDSNMSPINEKKSSVINSSENENYNPTLDKSSSEKKIEISQGHFSNTRKNIPIPNFNNKPNSLPNMGYHNSGSSSDSDQTTSSENLPKRKIIVPLSKDVEKVKINIIQPKIVHTPMRSTSTSESTNSSRSISSENTTSINTEKKPGLKNNNLKSTNKLNSNGSLPPSTDRNQFPKNETSSTSSYINRTSKLSTDTLSLKRNGKSPSNSNMYSSSSSDESLTETDLIVSNSKSLDKKETILTENEKNKINLQRKPLSSNNSNSSRSISTSAEEKASKNKFLPKSPIYIDRQEKIINPKSPDKKTHQLPLIICVSPPTTSSRDELSSKNSQSMNNEYDKKFEENENEYLSDSSENSSFSTSSEEIQLNNDREGALFTDRIENTNFDQRQNGKLSRKKQFSSSSNSDTTESSMLSKEDSLNKDNVMPRSEHGEQNFDEKLPQYIKNKKQLPVIEKKSPLMKTSRIKESIPRPFKNDWDTKSFSIDRREKFTNLNKSELKAEIKRSISVPQYFEQSTKDPVLSPVSRQTDIQSMKISQTSKSMSDILDENFEKRKQKCLSYELISVVLKDKEASNSSSEYSISTSDDSENDNIKGKQPSKLKISPDKPIICESISKEKDVFNFNEDSSSKNYHIEKKKFGNENNSANLERRENCDKEESTSESLSISSSSLDHITSESNDDKKKKTKYIDRREKILYKENNPNEKLSSNGQRKVVADSTDEDISFSLTNLAEDNMDHIIAINRISVNPTLDDLNIVKDNSMGKELIKKEFGNSENKENTDSTISLNSSSLIVTKNIKIRNDHQARLISRSSQTLPMKKIEKDNTSREKSKSLEKPLFDMNLIPISYSMPGSLGDIVESRYHEYTETWSRQSPIESDIIKNSFKTEKVSRNLSSNMSTPDSLNKYKFTKPLTDKPRPVPSYLSPVNAFPYIPSDQEFGSNDSIVDDYSADCNENEFVTKYKSLPEFVSSLSNSSLPRASVQTKTFDKKITPTRKSNQDTINLNYGAVENKKYEADRRKVSLTSVTTDSSYLEKPILKDKKIFNHCASSDSLSSFSNLSSIQNSKPISLNMKQKISDQHFSSTSSSSDSDTEVGVQPNLLQKKSNKQLSLNQPNGKFPPFSKTNINSNKEKQFLHSKSLPAKQIPSSSESSDFTSSSENDSNLYHF